jgi:cytochrome c oxidase subunit 4
MKELDAEGEGPWKVLLVGGALVLFTTLSFGLAQLHAGLVAALLIALTKASLIALFYMHLREQRSSNALVFVTAIFFVILMLTGTLLELATRFEPSVAPGPFGKVTP